MDMTEPRKFENEVRPLRLSEAIRIGARMRPQCQASIFYSGMSCALGAAYEGKTGETFVGDRYDLIVREFPVLGKRRESADDGYLSKLGEQIYRMNDTGMTREAIADWLESIGE